MSEPTRGVTRLLNRMQAGDVGAANDLLPLVYAELQTLAKRLMGRERGEHTLQPTALVHEAWLRLCGAPPQRELGGRREFYGIAARAMRQVLVDHARARSAMRRGGGAEQVPLDDVVAAVEGGRIELLTLHEAIQRLEERDPDLARLVELRFFAGLTIDETADVLERTPRQVQRAWSLARGFLHRELMRGSGREP